MRQPRESDAPGLVDEVIERWRAGEQPDAAAFLERHPRIAARKSLVLDLIHEEFCLRQETGETFVPSTFIERFPQYQRSIAKMLAVENYGAERPDFAATLAESPWPQVGQAYHGFEIVEPLGRGALARVYLAREPALGGRPVVVKVAPHGAHEAQLLGKLAHDNIVPIHSVRHDERTGMTVICLPFLGTATILDLLDRVFAEGRSPPTSAADIGLAARAYQPAGLVKAEALANSVPLARWTYQEGVAWLLAELSRGLAAAHEVGVVHRDIKPSNVLLGWSGRPMLLDFNLSTGLEQRADRLGGTLAYMAPERIFTLLTGEAPRENAVDPRADLFSLGVLGYELLTGKLPVEPAGADQCDDAGLRRWLAAREQPVTPPSQCFPGGNARVDQIVLRCLSPKPENRFASAAELARAWDDFLAPRRRAARWAGRHRRALLAGGVAAALGAAAGFGMWRQLPTAYERSYRRAIANYDQGEYAAAIVDFSACLAEEPRSVAALFGRAQAHRQLGDPDSARLDYVAAARIENRPLFWFCAGCCQLRSSSGSALNDLTQALKLGYDPAAVYLNLGKYYHYQGREIRAIPFLDRALEANRSLQEAYYLRSIARVNELASDNDPMLKVASGDIEAALRLGPWSIALGWLAARVFAWAGRSDRESSQRAEEQVRLLLRHGESRKQLEGDTVLGPIVARLGQIEAAAGTAPVLREVPMLHEPPASAVLPPSAESP
ncbi:MAG: protein kinase [Pirellulaceae bacterium]|nr:protein kinase [Pirellulaceae bacterium]